MSQLTDFLKLFKSVKFIGAASAVLGGLLAALALGNKHGYFTKILTILGFIEEKKPYWPKETVRFYEMDPEAKGEEEEEIVDGKEMEELFGDSQN